MIERDIVKHGVKIGEYAPFCPEKVIDMINEKCIARGMNYINLSPAQYSTADASGNENVPASEKVLPEHFLYEWAKHCADNKIYFAFNGGGDRPTGGIDAEKLKKIKEIAGEYFLSYNLSELGSVYANKGSGYGCPYKEPWKDLQQPKDNFINIVRKFGEENSGGGVVETSLLESGAHMSFECEAGLSFPTFESLAGDTEIGTAFARGTQRAYNCERFGLYIPHNWYGGQRNEDPLKIKRFMLSYYHGYLSGCGVFVLESADEKINTHGTDLGYDNPISAYYRKCMEDFAKFTKADFRPVGGPKVKVAFVRGNLDGYSFRHTGSSLWRGHMQEEFGYAAPEYTWRVLDVIKHKKTWAETHNYGEVDLSGAPAYGLYDVIPANVGVEIFSKYDYLIFVGWNTMTDEIYENLKAYVRQGGRLFMTAAHLNTTNKRTGEMSLIRNGDVSDLFGCKLDAENAIHTEDGSKFTESIVPEFKWCKALMDMSDPFFADGYADYAKVELTTGVITARLANAFRIKNPDALPASLVENKVGDGYAVLMTSLDYPSGANFAMYCTLVREILTASHRQAHIKVYGADSLRFSVYEGDKVYLLNTDFDNKIFATVDYGTEKKEFVLNPGELKPVEREECYERIFNS